VKDKGNESYNKNGAYCTFEGKKILIYMWISSKEIVENVLKMLNIT
jgi:hypothetical protein